MMCDNEFLNYAVEFDILKPEPAQINDVISQQQNHLYFNKNAQGLPKRSKKTEMLAQQIANADDLVQQVRKAVEERQLVEERLQDFQKSAQDIKELYEQEKILRIEFERKFKTTHQKYVELEEEHTRKILEFENLQELSSQLRGTLEYNDLVVRHIKLAQEIYEQGNMRRRDKELLNKLRQYCQERNINIPQYKKSRKHVKIDVGVQCDNNDINVSCRDDIDLTNENTLKSITIDVGTQYISTVATRGTNTHDLICQRDFGQIFPTIPSSNSVEKLDIMLNELLEYDISSYLLPVSPLAVLDDEHEECNIPTFETKSVGTETSFTSSRIETKSVGTETSFTSSRIENKSVATETTIWPPVIVKKSIAIGTCTPYKISIGTVTHLPEMHTRETCTYLCNLERNIGYIPSVQSAIDAINDLNVTQMSGRQHDMHASAAESVLFNKLWGIFGCMVSALINNEQLTTSSDNALISSVLPKTVFSSWYKAACSDNLITSKNVLHSNENLHMDSSGMSTDVTSSSMDDEPDAKQRNDDLRDDLFSNSDEINSSPRTCRERSSSERSTDSQTSSCQQYFSKRITRSSVSNTTSKTTKKCRITPLKAALRSYSESRENTKQIIPAHVKTQPVKYSARLKNKQIAAAGEILTEKINLNMDIGDNIRLIGQPKKRIAHQRNLTVDKNNAQQCITTRRLNCKRMKIDNSEKVEKTTKSQENLEKSAKNSKENDIEEVTTSNYQTKVVEEQEEEEEKEIEIIKPKLFVKQNLIANNYNEHLLREEQKDQEKEEEAESSMSDENENAYMIERKNEDNEDENDTDNELIIDESNSPLEILELPENPCQMDLEPPKPPIVIPLDLDDKLKCKKPHIKRHTNFMASLIKSTMNIKKRKTPKCETKKSTYLSILKLNLQQYMNQTEEKKDNEEEAKATKESKAEETHGTALILKLVNENIDYSLLAKTIIDFTRQKQPFGEQQNNPHSNNLVKKIWQLVFDLQRKYPKFCSIFSCEIERILFHAQLITKVGLDELINLLKLNLLCENIAKNLKHAARLMIAKCLYYYNVRAMPLIYIILCDHPTALPHREYTNYDKSDALLCVIQHSLMCTKYDMDNKELRHRELLSKLRFEYHYEPFQPDRNVVLNNLITQLRTGTNLRQLSYAFALFCKRIDQHLVWNTVLNTTLIPLANEWLQQMHCAERISVLLDCISQVVKPLPLQTDVSVFFTLFQSFLSSSSDIVREAAVRAILRLQRFGYVNCFNSLLTFHSDRSNNMNMQHTTLAMLRTFINRKPLKFWQEIIPDEFS